MRLFFFAPRRLRLFWGIKIGGFANCIMYTYVLLMRKSLPCRGKWGNDMTELRKDADAIVAARHCGGAADAAVKRALEGRVFGSGRVRLVAAGKGAWQMAATANKILGERIEAGVVVTKYGHSKGAIGNFDICEAGHPVPDQNSFDATELRWPWCGILPIGTPCCFYCQGRVRPV